MMFATVLSQIASKTQHKPANTKLPNMSSRIEKASGVINAKKK
jgi:hypothetical protein